MNSEPEQPAPDVNQGSRPLQRVLLRGLGIMLPPLLTIVLLLWALNTIDSYVLRPIESLTQRIIVWRVGDIRELSDFPTREAKIEFGPNGKPITVLHQNTSYVPVGEQWIPRYVYENVNRNPGEFIPATAQSYYARYVKIEFMPRATVVPVFVLIFVLLLYFLGKFMAAGVGRILLSYAEAMITRLPLVRNVYSSVKQVTDFLVAERTVEYNRVVAVEYPRKGMWSIGFVTGESMLDIRSAANEPVLTVLMPTSPMPATGFTITVRKSEAVDLNLTIDQAIQFVVSCGVVVPPHQQQNRLAAVAEMQRAVNAKINGAESMGSLESKSADVRDNEDDDGKASKATRS